MYISANRTPYLAEGFPAVDKAVAKSFVVVVRATFDVDDDGNCQVSEQQTPFVYADAHYGDPQFTSVRAESDFVPTKPKAEVLLDAFAMAPGGKPVERIEVALVGPSLGKRALITGERHWNRGQVGVSESRPRPFAMMPLAWHLAFGGTDNTFGDPARTRCDLRNPIGRGYQVNDSLEAIHGRPLPCIEHSGSLMTGWDQQPEPIGFGPVSRFAASRARFAGTYDEHWMDEVRPFLPGDFDDHYFQAAPADQQLDRLSEGMAFGCRHMNATGVFRVRLPQWSIPVSFMFDDRVRVPTLTADTVILRPHAGQIVLLGRVGAPLPRKFTRLREVIVGTHRVRALAAKSTGPART